jgi:PilZ domain
MKHSGSNGNRNGKRSTTVWDTPRLAPRYSNLRDLAVTYEGESEEIVTRPPDISTRGMFINTSRPFPEGAVLNVRFRLAISGEQFQVRCEVRYCLPGVGVGVEFIGISPEAVRAIENEIKAATSRSDEVRRAPRKRAPSRK